MLRLGDWLVKDDLSVHFNGRAILEPSGLMVQGVPDGKWVLVAAHLRQAARQLALEAQVMQVFEP